MNRNHDESGQPTSRQTPKYKVTSDFDHDALAQSSTDPEILVVKEKPASGSAYLLPPLLIVLLGTAFLAYRTRADNWQGLSELFASGWTAPAKTPDVKDEPKAITLLDTPPARATTPPSGELDLGPEPANPAAEPEILAGDAVEKDIQAEAQKTRERIAELERLKAQEAKELAETADERRQADRQAPKRPRFALRGLPPGEIEKMIEAQRAQLQEQLAWVAKIHERELKEMAEMQRRFLRDGFDSPNPNWPPQGLALPRPRLGAPLLPRAAAPRGGENKPGDRVIRTPDGGLARLREFQSANGTRGFEWQWTPGQGRQNAAPRRKFFPGDDTPPPPEPKPQRRFD